MRKTILSVALAASSIVANAQLVTNDATWCNVIERAFKSQGIEANVDCDMQGYDKILRVVVDGKTASLPLEETNHADYSSEVFISVEPLKERHIPRELDPRIWPLRLTSGRCDAVFANPNDDAYLYETLEGALSNIPRVKLIHSDYTQQTMGEVQKLYVLKCNVLSMLHGERYAEMKEADKDKKNIRPRDTRPRLERSLAYLEVNVQMVDYATGEVIWQKHIKDDESTSSGSNDPMAQCRSTVAAEIKKGLLALYPTEAPRASVRGEITQVAEEKKGRVQTIYVNVGADNRIQKGDQFTVYRQFVVNGIEGEEKLGTIAATEVSGNSLTLCKIKKGEKEISDAIHNNDPLIIVSNW